MSPAPLENGIAEKRMPFSVGTAGSTRQCTPSCIDTEVIENNHLIHVDGPITNVVADRAIEFIRSNQSRPFFCYVPFQAIHEPFNCPEELYLKYRQLGYENHVARLYGMIEVLDNNIGRLLNCLDALDLTKETLVLFMVDDGASPGFDLSYQTRRMNPIEDAQRKKGWSRLLKGTKANIGEGGQISPFYARWPGKVPADRQVDLLSGFPTLADLAGVDLSNLPLPIRGRSLKPTLFGETQDFSDRIYFDGTNLYLIERTRAFKGNRPRIRELSAHYQHYKYVREDRLLIDGKDEIRDFLYDLDADPVEAENITASEPELLNYLKTATKNWFDSIVNSGRAFKEVTFPVGSWNERATPVNLDAATRIFGSIERDKGPGFSFTNWKQAGDGLQYHVEVLESGYYSFTIDYRFAGSPSGAVFEVTLGHSTASIEVRDPHSATSAPVFCDKGLFDLEIRLKVPGKSHEAVEWLDFLSIERVRHEEAGICGETGFELIRGENPPVLIRRTNVAKEFAFPTPASTEAIELHANEILTVRLDSETPENIRSWSVFMGFECLATSHDPNAEFQLPPAKTGRQTLTVEWTDLSGNQNVATVALQVRSSVQNE